MLSLLVYQYKPGMSFFQYVLVNGIIFLYLLRVNIFCWEKKKICLMPHPAKKTGNRQ